MSSPSHSRGQPTFRLEHSEARCTGISSAQRSPEAPAEQREIEREEA